MCVANASQSSVSIVYAECALGRDLICAHDKLIIGRNMAFLYQFNIDLFFPGVSLCYCIHFRFSSFPNVLFRGTVSVNRSSIIIE